MSAEKNRSEAARWLETARGDLETCRILFEAARWAHACFHAHQAAEKALKALWYDADLDPWGHSVLSLLTDLREASPSTFARIADLADAGADLDQFYIPTRYPNGLPDLTPEQAFTRHMATTAMALARSVVDRVGGLLG